MLKEAVKRFTYSLAGYTVATYVLVCVIIVSGMACSMFNTVHL